MQFCMRRRKFHAYAGKLTNLPGWKSTRSRRSMLGACFAASSLIWTGPWPLNESKTERNRYVKLEFDLFSRRAHRGCAWVWWHRRDGGRHRQDFVRNLFDHVSRVIGDWPPTSLKAECLRAYAGEDLPSPFLLGRWPAVP